MSETNRMQQGALKAKEKFHIKNLKIVHFDSNDHILVTRTKATADAFSSALGITGQITEVDILSALQQVHIASDKYYTLAHAAAWNTTFEFPQEAIAADRTLWDQCCSQTFTFYSSLQQGASRPSWQTTSCRKESTSLRYMKLKHTINSLLFEKLG